MMGINFWVRLRDIGVSNSLDHCGIDTKGEIEVMFSYRCTKRGERCGLNSTE